MCGARTRPVHAAERVRSLPNIQESSDGKSCVLSWGAGLALGHGMGYNSTQLLPKEIADFPPPNASPSPSPTPSNHVPEPQLAVRVREADAHTSHAHATGVCVQ